MWRTNDFQSQLYKLWFLVRNVLDFLRVSTMVNEEAARNNEMREILTIYYKQLPNFVF